MRTMAFMWRLFFLCATMAPTVRRTGKTLRRTIRFMTVATRSTSSVLECVLGSDIKGFFFPVGQGLFSYIFSPCVRHRVNLLLKSRVAHHASNGRDLHLSRSAARRHADFAPMLSCRAVPFARRRRRRVSNNCACVAAENSGEVSFSKCRKGRIRKTRPRRHTDVRKKQTARPEKKTFVRL